MLESTRHAPLEWYSWYYVCPVPCTRVAGTLHVPVCRPTLEQSARVACCCMRADTIHASCGADVGQSRRRCGPVAAQMWAVSD